jgi:hypothetical protein
MKEGYCKEKGEWVLNRITLQIPNKVEAKD